MTLRLALRALVLALLDRVPYREVIALMYPLCILLDHTDALECPGVCLTVDLQDVRAIYPDWEEPEIVKSN